MFQPNWPSSGVQVVMVKDSAAHCNAAFSPPIVVSSGYFGYVGYHQLQVTRCNYNRRKENRITVSSRGLNHNSLYTWRWPVRPKHVVSNKGIWRKNSEWCCTQMAQKLQKSDLYSVTGCWNITLATIYSSVSVDASCCVYIFLIKSVKTQHKWNMYYHLQRCPATCFGSWELSSGKIQ
jgi:hypothetical protein